ncbi:MAG: dephospho-CoA kinase [Clostridia bacterium]|nr:dephospho-CoA kinase [Clostridia bacterium]
MMKIIGLTGPTGAGKSTVSAALRENGFFIADGDLIAREIVMKGSPVLTLLADAFGQEILSPDGELIRSELAKRAFKDEKSLALLNSVTHPEIDRIIFDRIGRAKGFKAAVIDAAALIESKIANKCDLLCVVTAPDEIRLQRIMNRDGISEEAALLRMNAQHPASFYTERADIVINNFPPYSLDEELKKITSLF